jgi:DNA-binding MarR family transcriptional regulator
MASQDPKNDRSTLLIERLSLEIISNFYLLDRHKDEIGLITQWGAGAWLILQALSESEPMLESELAEHQHISSSYNHKLVAELLENELLEKVSDEKNALLSITTAGKHSLKKLTEVLHNNFPNWAESFSAEELEAAVSTLSKFRHVLAQ